MTDNHLISEQRSVTMAQGEVHTQTSDPFRGRTVVAVSGELDLAVAPALETQLSAALAEGRDVVVDLSSSTFIDSVSLGTLTLGLERAEQAGVGFSLVVSDPRVLRTFELTGLTDRFAIFDTLADLTEHLDQAESA
jgi:anti-sigma B factor antagonist